MIYYRAMKLATAPILEPVTAADVKSHARIDGSDEDDLLTTYYIPQAREAAEAETGRALVPQTWDIWWDCFPSAIELPMPPTISVTWVKYTDEAGDVQTWDAANYTVDTNSEPARIVPAYSISWPTIRNIPSAVTVRFIAGYDSGASPEDASAVPAAIKHAIMTTAATFFNNREDFALPERGMASAIQVLPTAARSLLAKYRVRFF